MRIVLKTRIKSIDFVIILYYNLVMENLNNILSTNLIKLRKSKNLTQAELASLLQYSDKTISKWENGEIIPSVENLIKLANIYSVSLDEITKPIEDTRLQPSQDLSTIKRNKILISLLAIAAVWIIATIVFVYTEIIWQAVYWKVFIWAVPASCIVALSFIKVWGNRKLGIIISSLLVWTLITAFFLEFLEYNLFAIYFIGVPVQLSIVLWSSIKKTNK